MAGLGIKKFVSGETLTADEVNGYLMDQAVCVFDTVGDRNTAFTGASNPTLSEGRVCYIKATNKIQYYDGSNWVDSEQFSVSQNSQVSPGILQLDRLVDGTAAQIIVCDSTGTPTYVTLSGDATISDTGVISIGANNVALGTDTTGNYIATITGTANQVTVSGSGSETAAVTLSLPQDIHSAANPTFAGTTSGSVRVGITADNEIDTTSGNLILDSTGGTVSVDDILSVSGSAAVTGNMLVSGSVSVVGNIVGHSIPESAASLTNAIDGKILKVSGTSSSITLTTTGGSWTNGTQFTIINTNNTSASTLTVAAGTGTTFLAAPLAGANVKLRTLYSTATFIYEQGTGWYVIGDLTST